MTNIKYETIALSNAWDVISGRPLVRDLKRTIMPRLVVGDVIYLLVVVRDKSSGEIYSQDLIRVIIAVLSAGYRWECLYAGCPSGGPDLADDYDYDSDLSSDPLFENQPWRLVLRGAARPGIR